MMDSAELITVATTDGATDAIEASSKLYGIILTTDGTNDATCTIKNGAAGATKLVVKVPGGNDCDDFMFAAPVKFTGTINVTTAGTGASAYVLVGK